MGTHCSSELYRGHILKSKNYHNEASFVDCSCRCCYGRTRGRSRLLRYNPGFYGYNPGFYGYYGHQQQWPSVRAPGFSSTCFGCRGKRSAEAEADAEPGYYGYPYGFHGYPYGLHGYPYLGYRGIATSFEARSPQGLRGKRSAEPGYYHPYGYYPYHFGHRAYGPGIAGHPTGTSFVARSTQGLDK